jgi:hypothetical protein
MSPVEPQVFRLRFDVRSGTCENIHLDPVTAVNFRPVDQLAAAAGQRLRDVEGRAFEKYEEHSRKRIGDFPQSERINDY